MLLHTLGRSFTAQSQDRADACVIGLGGGHSGPVTAARHEAAGRAQDIAAALVTPLQPLKIEGLQSPQEAVGRSRRQGPGGLMQDNLPHLVLGLTTAARDRSVA